MYYFYILLLTHFIADFVLQKEEWAVNKGKDLMALGNHIYMYFIATIVGTMVFFISFHFNGESWAIMKTYFVLSVIYSIISSTHHGIIDYFSSKLTSKLFIEKKYYTKLPNFGAFTFIGLDQMIHIGLIIPTFKLALYIAQTL